MIIDTHTHLGRNQHLTASVDQLLASMDKAKIDKALVFAAPMFDAPNQWVLDQIKPHKDRLLGVAAASLMDRFGVQPHHACLYQAEQLADWYGEGEIVAAKFYTGYEHYFPTEATTHLGILNRIGCPVIFHSGDCFSSIKTAKLKYAHPLHIDEVAVDYPGINFVIAHMGFPWIKDAAEVCYKNPNCYADVSGFVYGKFDDLTTVKFNKALTEFLDIADHSKLLFGSDWPISDQKSYLDVLGGAAVDHMQTNAKRAFKLA